MRAEQITAALAYHGEGPVWSSAWGGLRWVDMLAGDVLALDESGEVARRHVGTVAAVVRPRVGGGCVIATEVDVQAEGPDGQPEWSVTLETAGRGVRLNEGGCDPDGRFYCGSMAYDQRAGAGTLFRLTKERMVEPMLTGVTVSNGLEWSPDGSLAYYVDTPTQRIDVFDYDSARGLSGRRPFVTIDGADGSPDGLTVDASGGVWVALWGGGAVRRYDDAGALDAVIEVPARQVSACTFGGEELDQLFITTSREGLSPGDEPGAGALFRCVPGGRGRAVRPFAG